MLFPSVIYIISFGFIFSLKEIIAEDVIFVSTDCLCIMSPVELVMVTSIVPKIGRAHV